MSKCIRCSAKTRDYDGSYCSKCIDEISLEPSIWITIRDLVTGLLIVGVIVYMVWQRWF